MEKYHLYMVRLPFYKMRVNHLAVKVLWGQGEIGGLGPITAFLNKYSDIFHYDGTWVTLRQEFRCTNAGSLALITLTVFFVIWIWGVGGPGMTPLRLSHDSGYFPAINTLSV